MSMTVATWRDPDNDDVLLPLAEAAAAALLLPRARTLLLLLLLLVLLLPLGPPAINAVVEAAEEMSARGRRRARSSKGDGRIVCAPWPVDLCGERCVR